MTAFGTLGSAWDAVSAGGTSPDGDVRRDEQTLRERTLLAVDGVGAAYGAYQGTSRRIAAGYAGTRTGATALTESLMAYELATSAGNSRAYAAAYAASQFRPLARIGALATAMGQTSPVVEQG